MARGKKGAEGKAKNGEGSTSKRSRSQIVTINDLVQEPKAPVLPIERIASVILVLRGQKVILDSSLAGLYEVETRALVQAVKRNLERFPGDFMFQLTKLEVMALTLQRKISFRHNLSAMTCPKKEAPSSLAITWS